MANAKKSWGAFCEEIGCVKALQEVQSKILSYSSIEAFAGAVSAMMDAHMAHLEDARKNYEAEVFKEE